MWIGLHDSESFDKDYLVFYSEIPPTTPLRRDILSTKIFFMKTSRPKETKIKNNKNEISITKWIYMKNGIQDLKHTGRVPASFLGCLL